MVKFNIITEKNADDAESAEIKPFRDRFKSFFAKHDRRIKLKTLGKVFLVVLFLVSLYDLLGIGSRKESIQENITVEDALPEFINYDAPTFTPIPPKPIDPNAWVIKVPESELQTTGTLVENYLIYATKRDYRSTVYKRYLQNGTQTVILEFDEVEKAEKSGNLWEGLPPNIALSPDKNEIVYIDNEGLKLYNLQGSTAKVFIKETVPPVNEDAPPKWSVSEMAGTYSLASPLWSFDGKYISFLRSHYEGASFGIIDTESGNFIKLEDVFGGYSNLSWSPVERIYVKASSGGYEGTGLFVSAHGNIARAENIAMKLGETENTPFLEANLSPDGSKIVFTIGEPYNGAPQRLAIADIDGSRFTIIDEGDGYILPFFSEAGNEIFFVQKRESKYVLVEYILSSKSFIDNAVLPEGFNGWRNPTWTKEGLLSIVGVSLGSGLTLGGDNTRFFLIDLTEEKLIYASPVINQFTTFAGLSN